MSGESGSTNHSPLAYAHSPLTTQPWRRRDSVTVRPLVRRSPRFAGVSGADRSKFPETVWRVRQMGWVSLGLLGMVVGWVALVTNSPAGWEIANRRVRRDWPTFRQAAELELLPAGSTPSGTTPRPIPTAAARSAGDLRPAEEQHANAAPLHPLCRADDRRSAVKDWGFMNFHPVGDFGDVSGFRPAALHALLCHRGVRDRSRIPIARLAHDPADPAERHLSRQVPGSVPWCLGVRRRRLYCVVSGGR